MGKYVQYISVNSTCAFLGPETSRALPMFHSFTGCDTTSCFFGKGKKSAWEAWKSFPDVTEAFTFLGNHPYYQLDVDDSIFKLLEIFTVVNYDNVLDGNEAGKEIFTKKNRTLENTPPTQDSLLQHALRAVYQGSIWYTSLQSVQMVPSPEGWGWCEMDGTWKPVWMTPPEAAKACLELLKCGCKQGRAGRCKCRKANLPCTGLCQCSGECTNNEH
ncbi:uncharacterized protein [Montipora foliosa]|uniref:uncharacterized protein n=1 Tax=Montipora foliosa TaxID=591990 RepID=UPI0035F1F75C